VHTKSRDAFSRRQDCVGSIDLRRRTLASNLQYHSSIVMMTITIFADGNPKVSTVFWRNFSEFAQDLRAVAD
jgi:hypothetical protein